MTATTTCPKSIQCGWNGAGERVTLPALIAGEDVDAISMPAAFGALVLAELDIMMLAGPVLADDGGSWTFLVQRAGTRRPAVPTDLLPLGVRVVPAGTLVTPLATEDHSPAIWWTVIGAARRVAHRHSRVA
ncbi:MAG: hypothetical protein WBA97_06165 [Actinophytocola sp.]|uniref:hypothetical protein n=1 Tax=Actinophytocola sp. TaxID=1872138 RepID=UPI003C76F75A